MNRCRRWGEEVSISTDGQGISVAGETIDVDFDNYLGVRDQDLNTIYVAGPSVAEIAASATSRCWSS